MARSAEQTAGITFIDTAPSSWPRTGAIGGGVTKSGCRVLFVSEVRDSPGVLAWDDHDSFGITNQDIARLR